MTPIHSLAQKFHTTFYTKQWPGDLSPLVSDLSIAEAYQVQDRVAQMRIDGGEEAVGFKVGCTSQAIRSQFGLQEPISGRLFTPYIYKADVNKTGANETAVQLDWRDYINCAIEPEMVFKIGRELGEEDLSDDALIDAIEYVSPGIELHNFKFWFSPPTSQELICSGGIHAGLVIGRQKVLPEELSFKNELFRVYKDEEPITQAPASEIMGGPLKSLRWLVNSLVRRGMVLEKGSFVIPGSPVELVPITQDTNLRIEIDGVGHLCAGFKAR